MDDISLKINEIEIDVDKNDVDKNDVDKIFTFDDIGDEPHNDNEDNEYEIESLCVSDDKKLAYIDTRGYNVIDMDKNKFETKNIGIFNNDSIQLYNFMNHTGLFLLPSLFYYTPDEGIWNSIEYCWNNKYKNIFNETFKPTKFVFGILNGCVWKSKFDEKMPKTNFSSEYSDELNKENNKIIEYNDNDKINKETYEHSNINLYKDTVSTLFQKAIINDSNSKKELTESDENLIKWDIRVYNGKIKLEVFDTEWNLINSRIENYCYPYKSKRYLGDFINDHRLIASSLFNNNNDIVILTTFANI
ncbi:hypothetical protein GLOIN_2v1767492 [Rhizophagus irregularis DAOM 181602=DAOM 197198]|nr:hypothetical protein GLOIN_2v1767492 [Rhizophagus irregularis DAOM 181602=DAOM 197198]